MRSAENTSRLIVVEEHFATDAYYEQLETLAVSAEEEPEHQFMLGFPHNRDMRRRFTDPDAILDSMDGAGIDVSVLSPTLRGCRSFADATRASELAGQMNHTWV